MKLEKCIQNGIRPIGLFNYLKELSKANPGRLRIMAEKIKFVALECGKLCCRKFLPLF
jgi:hypothetical protein